MKKLPYHFNDLLRRYNYYIRKLSRLQISGRNLHRQGVIKKHIARIFLKLQNLQVLIKKRTVAGALTVASVMVSSQITAQTNFEAPVIDPFGIVDPISVERAFDESDFIDLDGDGDFDLMSIEYDGDFYYYENIGTNTTPEYDEFQNNPFGLDNVGINYTGITLADIDADGDLDMLVSGDLINTFLFYENIGNNTSPDFEAPVSNPFNLDGSSISIDYINFSSRFVDLDDDGDFDIMGGTFQGVFAYFENTGDETSPNFTAPVLEPFGLVNPLTLIGTDVTFFDADGDNDLDMLSGTYAGGNFVYFENIGDINSPNFAALIENPFNLVGQGQAGYSRPTAVDIDDDGDLDIMALNIGYYGTHFYYENTDIVLGIDDVEEALSSITVYPNPAKNTVTIGNPQQQELNEASIYDVSGRLIKQVDFLEAATEKNIDISFLTPGNYVITVRSQENVKNLKLVVTTD